MADGVKGDYDRIKKTDIFEFWLLFDLWEKRMSRDNELKKAEAGRRKI
jgi:hypothetical protein